MAIQAQLNYNASNGFPLIGDGVNESEFSLMNNNDVPGIRNNQSHVMNNRQGLFHHQQPYQYRSQNLLDVCMEKQKQEIDQFIKLQNERLRYVLQEQRKQEIGMILRKMESKAMFLMNQKEVEMTKALSKNMELENTLKKLEMENQTWQRMARENEAMVQTLNSTTEQVREKAATCHDEGSFCGGGDSFPVSNSCLNCGSNRETRVLFLPCRHLCCCTNCEAGLVVCPICNTPKNNRIEAFLS